MSAFDFPTSPTDGQQYTANGVTYAWSAADTAWKGQGSSTPLANSMRVLQYATPGTVAYVKPAGLKYLQVELWGGGGGSQAAGATAAATTNASGGGGGGAYVRKLYRADELAASEPLVVGAAGIAGVAAVAAGAGGDSTFKAMSAGGGFSNGGVAAVALATSPGNGYQVRAFGGVASGGDVNADGGGSWNAQIWGGLPLGGIGGTAGGPSDGMEPTRPPAGSTTQPARLGKVPGGGGGGAALSINQAAVDGAAGGQGWAILTEYYTENDTVGGGYLPLSGGTLSGNLAAPTVRLTSTADVSLSSTAHALQVGPDSGVNLRLDNNEIQAVNNGASNTLGLNLTGGDVIIGNAASIVTLQGGQLKFPASQVVSADPNAIDDYEEGLFTPVIVGATTAGVGTYSFQSGSYTKIGRMVYIQGQVIWSAHTGVGSLRASGLPFTSSIGNNPTLAVYASNLTFSGQLAAYVIPNQTSIQVRVITNNVATIDVGMDTAGQFNFSGCYEVA